MKNFKAKVTQYDNGKIVIEPYAKTETPRYNSLLELEHGKLTTTQQHYRLVLLFPKKEGEMKAVKNLLCESTQTCNFLTNLFTNGEKA